MSHATDATTTTAPLTPTATGHAPVNGLAMYWERYGDESGVPLVLLHGGVSNLAADFAGILPLLAEGRTVIGFEQQAHGRTRDIDREISFEVMAEDTAAALAHLGIARVDILGFSVGAGIGLELAIRRPELVRRLILISGTYDQSGMHPEMLGGMEQLTPEMLHGSPYHDTYVRIAPDPAAWPEVIDRIKQLDRVPQHVPAEAVSGIAAPTLLILADSDIIRPEHGVELFRLLGGGVVGDIVGLPRSQLAILPGTSHTGIMLRPDLLAAMIPPFLAAADEPPA